MSFSFEKCSHLRRMVLQGGCISLVWSCEKPHPTNCFCCFTSLCRAKLLTQRPSPARTRASWWSRRLQSSRSSTRRRLRWRRAATRPCRTPTSTRWGSARATQPCACSPGPACAPPASSRTSPTSCGSSCSTGSRHSRYSPSGAHWLPACSKWAQS